MFKDFYHNLNDIHNKQLWLFPRIPTCTARSYCLYSGCTTWVQFSHTVERGHDVNKILGWGRFSVFPFRKDVISKYSTFVITKISWFILNFVFQFFSLFLPMLVVSKSADNYRPNLTAADLRSSRGFYNREQSPTFTSSWEDDQSNGRHRGPGMAAFVAFC